MAGGGTGRGTRAANQASREHARRPQRCDRASHLSAVTEVAENPAGRSASAPVPKWKHSAETLLRQAVTAQGTEQEVDLDGHMVHSRPRSASTRRKLEKQTTACT